MPDRTPRLKRIRRLGTPLPGLTRKEPRRPYPSGQHAATRRPRWKSEYRIQLEEKQKLRWSYGVSERQLRRYFERASRESGVTGETLLSLLERRLDSVVFRLGFAPTIPSARQLVTHGHILLDRRRVDRPGVLIARGSRVEVGERGRRIPDVEASVEQGPQIQLPSFLRLDPEDGFLGEAIGLPVLNDVPFIVDIAAVVEFYAR